MLAFSARMGLEAGGCYFVGWRVCCLALVFWGVGGDVGLLAGWMGGRWGLYCLTRDDCEWW